MGVPPSKGGRVDPTKWNVPFPAIVAALFAIVVVRAGSTYLVGRLAAYGARRTPLSKLLDSPAFAAASERIDRYGAPVVGLSFLTIGFQTLANLAAGATRMRWFHYLPALAVGGLAWALIYATIGTVGLDLFGRLYAISPVGAGAALVGLVAVIAGYITWQHRRATKGLSASSSS